VEKRGVVEIFSEEGLLDDSHIDAIMYPTNLTRPSLLLGMTFDQADRTHTHLTFDPDMKPPDDSSNT
jgi:hypothetical protein